ncbi:gamma-glutamylcyclotransferase family protein [Propionispora sp. 2/2-37]|uniref:gamma-glutamylcyclotransferase family protein n=1 Tax=Propionispora sp. 2/2-37 TaxID=1677858 RepID=UPI0012E15D97|nr:gamma-glutamylcyclotransferase family protein [Propionispora sp. 2/2-37]
MNQMRLYFAYGSNINPEYMRLKCSDPRVLGIARLNGYRMDFFGYSTTWDGAVETVVEDASADIWGVLYQLDEFDWNRLDNCEDVRADGTGEYFHYPVEVIDGQGKLTAAILYRKARQGTPEIPSREYLGLIVKGAEEQKLPAAYVARLKTLAAKPASYAVPRRPSYNRVGAAGGASGCGDCSECSG